VLSFEQGPGQRLTLKTREFFQRVTEIDAPATASPAVPFLPGRQDLPFKLGGVLRLLHCNADYMKGCFPALAKRETASQNRDRMND
jgi:hypothetical protein